MCKLDLRDLLLATTLGLVASPVSSAQILDVSSVGDDRPPASPWAT